MRNFDVTEILEQEKLAVSQIRVTVLDRRTSERIIAVVYQFGEFYNEQAARKNLDRIGYDLVNSEIMDTQYGELTLKGIYDAFAAAGREK